MPRRVADARTAILADAARLDGTPEAAHAAATRWMDLDPDVLVAALREAWPRLGSESDRRHILKELFLSRHPRALEVLDLGMGDADPRVRSWAAEFVGGVAFRDFRRDPEGYARWRSVHGALPLDSALRENALDFVDRLRQAVPSERREASRSLFEAVRTVNLEALGLAGLPALLEQWIASETPEIAENALRVLHRFPSDGRMMEAKLAAWIELGPEALARMVLRHVPEFGVADDFLRDRILPIARTRPALRSAALRALGRPGAVWAIDALLPWLVHEDEEAALAAAEALGGIGDSRAVPALVGAMGTGAGRAWGISLLALAPLTGVEPAMEHTVEWWGKWMGRRREKGERRREKKTANGKGKG